MLGGSRYDKDLVKTFKSITKDNLDGIVTRVYISQDKIILTGGIYGNGTVSLAVKENELYLSSDSITYIFLVDENFVLYTFFRTMVIKGYIVLPKKMEKNICQYKTCQEYGMHCF